MLLSSSCLSRWTLEQHADILIHIQKNEKQYEVEDTIFSLLMDAPQQFFKLVVPKVVKWYHSVPLFFPELIISLKAV